VTDDLRLLRWLGDELRPAADQPPAACAIRVLAGGAASRSAGPVEARPVEARSGAPARVGRLVAAVAAAAVVLTGSVVAADARLSAPAPERRAARSPGQVLELAARQVALTSSSLRARPDQFIHTESLVVREQVSVNGWMSRQGQVVRVRRWQSVDGTRDGLTQERGADAAGTAWTSERVPARAGDRPAPPADADAMYRFLYRPAPTGVREWQGYDPGADGLALERATDVLSSGTASPAVQEAVFTALRRIPRISLRARAVDVAGAPGSVWPSPVSAARSSSSSTPATYRYLGMNRRLASRFVELGRGTSVVVREAVQRVTVVDRVGDLG
jgi:hypothetical protein